MKYERVSCIVQKVMNCMELWFCHVNNFEHSGNFIIADIDEILRLSM